MRHTWLFLITLLFNSPLLAQDASIFSPDELNWIRTHPSINYTINEAWPVEYIEEGEHRGVTREYIDELGDISGIHFNFVKTQGWAQTRALAAEGKIDLVTGVNKNLLNEADYSEFSLSLSYFNAPIAVFTRPHAFTILSTNQLDGKLVAVQQDSALQTYLNRHHPAIRLRPEKDIDVALEQLLDGRIDAVVGIGAVLNPIVVRRFLGTLTWAGTLHETPYKISMGINKNSPLLVSIIEKSLANISSNKSAATFERWMENNDYGAPSWNTIFAYFSNEIGIISFGVLLIIILALYAWYAQIAAQRSESKKTAFLAMMSHEIRSPMNGVLSSIELLTKTHLSANQRELATLANISATNLLEMLDDVLDISKLEKKMVELDFVPTDVKLLAGSLVAVNQTSAFRHNTTIALKTVNLDHSLLLVDSIRIRQIISNLLSNAVKFTQNGKVELHIKLHSLTAQSGELSIVVSDTGIGIDLPHQKRLFQAFVQADSTITRRYGGSGLGLSICKQLIELMNGQIRLDSKLGNGTTVSCTLPVNLVAKPNTETVQELSLHEASVPARTQHLILVVEDDPINQRTISLQLSKLGYRMLIVDDGKQALTIVHGQREDIALILLDCHLPDIDGYEVARRIRAEERKKILRPLPIIAISASTNEAHQLSCVNNGIDGSLAKPLNLPNLQQLFELWLPIPATQITQSEAFSPPSHITTEGLFVQTSKEDISKLSEALADNGRELALHYSHRLYGAALAAHCDEIAKLARDLESQLVSSKTTPKNWRKTVRSMESALDAYMIKHL